MSEHSNSQHYNPMSTDSIEKITERREKALAQRAVLEEEIAEYKVVVNRLASTPDGQYFLRKLIRFAGIFTFDADINPAKMVEDKGKRAAYLQLVRPFLEISTRITLESET